jgi:hypothetical protein
VHRKIAAFVPILFIALVVQLLLSAPNAHAQCNTGSKDETSTR